MLERQFRNYFEIAKKMAGNAGENLLTCLESRLDNVVYRMGLARTRREARQMVSHYHFNVNGKKVNISSYRIKEGDVIALRESIKESQKIKDVLEANKNRAVPTWLEFNKDELSAKVVRQPKKEDLDYEIAENLIVELYSK
jgi:small subunit ribosomal protein S4